MPKINVIVPVYKTGGYLKRCVDSILGQKHKDFDLLLIDDGSTDKCGVICDEYAKKNSRISVIHQQNGGVAAAKNAGIRISNGTYLTFVDSDDFLDADCYSNLISFASSNSDMIISGVKYVLPDSLQPYAKLDFKKNYSFTRNDFRAYIPDLIDQRALNYHVAKLYKHCIIRDNNILFSDFKKTGGDDTVFNFDFLSLCSSVSVVNVCNYNYVSYLDSTSHEFSKDTFSRKKNLDFFLLHKTAEMDLNSDALKRILDKRFVVAAFWSACDYAECRSLSYKEYKKQFNLISTDERFRSAYLSVKDMPELDKGIHLIYGSHAFLFFNYANHTAKSIKGVIYKYVPRWARRCYKNMRKRYRSWIVQ